MPTTWSAVAPITSDLRPERWRHTSGCSFAGRWRISRQLLGRRVRVHRALRRLDRVHDADRVGPFLLLVRQIVVGRVGAGELGLAAGLGNGVGAEHRRHDRDVVGAAVDVPVERAPEVRRRPVLRRVEGDPEDLGELPLPNTSTLPSRLLNATWVASSMWRSRNTSAPFASSASASMPAARRRRAVDRGRLPRPARRQCFRASRS